MTSTFSAEAEVFVEDVAQELLRQPARELLADHALAQGQDLPVVGQHQQRSAEKGVVDATEALMPGTLFAAIATPMPVPHTKIPRSASPAAICARTGSPPRCGYAVLSASLPTPTSMTSLTRGSFS